MRQNLAPVVATGFDALKIPMLYRLSFIAGRRYRMGIYSENCVCGQNQAPSLKLLTASCMMSYTAALSLSSALELNTTILPFSRFSA